MRFNLCKLFLCSFLMLAGILFAPVSGQSVELIWQWCYNNYGWHGYGYRDYWSHGVNSTTLAEGVNPTNWIGQGSCIGFETAEGVQAWSYKSGNQRVNQLIFVQGAGGTAGDYSPPYGWTCWRDGLWNSAGYGGGVKLTNYYFVATPNESFSYSRWDCYDGTPYPGYGNKIPGNVDIIIYRTDYVPPFKYDCYFAIQGCAFFDNQTNKSVSFELSFDGNTPAGEIFTVSQSGSFYKKSRLYHLELSDNRKLILYPRWDAYANGTNAFICQYGTDPDNPDEYIYVVNCDYTCLNTNVPVVDPGPTNQPPPPPPDPTNQPPVTNYPPPPNPPVPTNNPPYPPYPPYPPWTNNPPPPQPPGPDTNTPPMPDPNPDGTNAISYDGIYSALRHALRDEGNAYDGAMPGDYPIDGAASGLMMQVAGYCSNLSRAAVQSASNTDLIVGRGYAILTGASGMLRDALPTSIGRIDSWSLPWFNSADKIKINLGAPPFGTFISLFRNFLKWLMYLSAFWMIFRLLRRTFGRSE